MTSEELKIFGDAIQTFGIQIQILIVFEEMAELQKELCKYLRYGESDEAVCRVAEELADVDVGDFDAGARADPLRCCGSEKQKLRGCANE